MQPKYAKAFELILSDKYRIVQHILFWGFFYADVVAGFFDPPFMTSKEDYTLQAILFLGDLIAVYFNLFFLIPKFLLNNKARLYILFTFLTLILFSIVNYTAHNMIYYDFLIENEIPREEWHSWSGLANAFIFQASVLGSAIGINIFKRFLRNRGRIEELENTNLKTELAYLKEQINPHFLFNALNNIYVQTRKRPEEASESILLLSDLLRYQLYDCAKEKVYLSGELDYLKNYLKLDQLRKNKADISFHINGNPNGKMVTPFIFLPFIENAVKHGLSLENESFIKINFDISDNDIWLIVENSIPNHKTPNRVGGIGLANVKRRLDLLYPNSHELIIDKTKDIYKVTLILNG